MVISFRLATSAAFAWTGEVAGVIDGDTLLVNRVGQQVRIRVYGVDCPELGTAAGRSAKGFTVSFLADKLIEVEEIATDKYGRTVAMVSAGGENLSAELVRGGQARVFRRYCERPVCRDWLALETRAREAGIGLWRKAAAASFRQRLMGK